MLLIEEIIQAKIKALKDVQENIFEYLKKAVDKHKNLFEDANIEQLEQGILNNGEEITPPYRPLTIQIKRIKGQPTNKVTLKDSGDFHRSIIVELESGGIGFDATDYKTTDLEKKYTINILGITDDNLKEILESTILEELIHIIKQEIQNA